MRGHSYTYKEDRLYRKISCIFMFLAWIGYILAGAWSIKYLVLVLFDKTAPWIASAIAGFFTGAVSIPVALVVWVLKASGVL